jgi:ABC-type multidrug transport system ATPase subunit
MLDEPSAGLDPRSVSWLLEFINVQSDNGKTIILSTHDLPLVEATADRVYVLNEQHQIIAESTPGKILSDRSLLIKANLVR